MSEDVGGTAVAPNPEPRHQGTGGSSIGDILRFVLRGVGQTLITCGVVVLLFVVYEVYVTNLFSHQKQTAAHHQLEQAWAQGKDPLIPLPGSTSVTIKAGIGIANIYVPRLGKSYGFTIVQGDTVPTDAQLEKGPVHYGGTALPGQVGDFALAGHRVGKGEPFLNLDQLRPGDAVIIETDTDWYVYRVKGDVQTGNLASTAPDGVPGREIVDPSDGNVILPVPNHPGATPTERLLTLTTCHPKFTATHRMVVHAVLDPSLTVARTSDTKPAAIEALYSDVS
jgi:sortase A